MLMSSACATSRRHSLGKQPVVLDESAAMVVRHHGKAALVVETLEVDHGFVLIVGYGEDAAESIRICGVTQSGVRPDIGEVERVPGAKPDHRSAEEVDVV